MLRLNQEAGGRWTKAEEGSNPKDLFSDGKGKPLYDPKTATAESVTQGAIEFLTRYADLWQLKNPSRELRRRSAQPNWQVEFRQWSGGVPVFDAGIDVFFTSKGIVQWIRSSYVPGLEYLDKTAKLTADSAIEAARQQLASSTQLSLEAARVGEKPILGVSAAPRNEPPRQPRLIYRFTLLFNGPTGRRGHAYGAACDVDAHTGEVVSTNLLYPQYSRPIS